MQGAHLSTLLIQEPAGTRRVGASLVLGGTQPELQLPQPREAPLRLERSGTQWWLRYAPGDPVFVNGRPVETDRVLESGDVIGTGGAHLVFALGQDEARLAVLPLRGNETIAPLEITALPGEEVAAGTREIEVAGTPSAAGQTQQSAVRAPRLSWRGALLIAASLVVVGIVIALLSIVPVPLQVTPVDASIVAPRSLHLRVGERLLLFPGERTIEVSRAGYRTERLQLAVSRALSSRTPRQIHLALLPGVLNIDTGGLAAEVLVDGERVGSLPGPVSAPAGRHTLIVRAPRHLDYLAEIDVKGAGSKQSLQAQLEPAWGWLELDTQPTGARVTVDGAEQGTAPLRMELDSGLRLLEVSAPGRRTWRSRVAIEPGQTLQLGRIDLASPPPSMVAAPAGTGAVPASASNAPSAPPPAPAPPAPRVQSAVVGVLILVPAGKFMQGSERREQGRRSNEPYREVTFPAPFYMSEREVTNGQFRLFKPGHASGIAADRTLDLDPQAVSNVSWDDAVAFCNWLSQREGLPVAYERRDGRWQLVTPRNTGYRLPTEAEWEYAARYVDGRRSQRFSWGDSLPMPGKAENVAGEETIATNRAADRGALVLPGHRDEHPVVAPVGTYGRSALGFADLDGNVSEWAHDVFASQLPAGPVADPTGDARDGPHAIRGANWRSSSVQELRLAWRDRSAGAQQWLGFRVARSTEVAP